MPECGPIQNKAHQLVSDEKSKLVKKFIRDNCLVGLEMNMILIL